jgi:NAD(P)-dependent dehydrogenase (short-subunit alcohol dehydrogenase family)
MADRLKDKVALVTGAGSIGPGWGNGKATAVLFAREGARVFAVDIRKEAVEETKGIIEGEGGTCLPHVADVSDASAVAAAVETCLDAYGRVDVLHNNVGIVQVGGPEEISESEWDRLMDVNVKSMYLTCRHVLPHMVRQGKGSVINVSSIASFHSLGYPSVSYCASKGAVNALTRNIALHYAPRRAMQRDPARPLEHPAHPRLGDQRLSGSGGDGPAPERPVPDGPHGRRLGCCACRGVPGFR